MKRFLAFILVVLILLPCATACQQSLPGETESAKTAPETVAEPKAEPESETAEPVEMIPQSEYEQSITRILIIGNSSSNDIFTLLGRVFYAQGFGGKSYTISYLYYSGCTFTQHVKFMENDAPVYDYYKTDNGVAKTKDPEKTMKYALEDEQWDVILLHPGGAEDVLHSDLQRAQRKKIEAYVNKYVPTEHVFGFHMRCPNPNDSEIWGPSWPVKPPAGYREQLEKNYNFDPYVQHAKYNEAVKAHILTDPTYKYCVSTNAGVFYAQEVLGIAQTALYRDYTHLSDFARVLASYCFYVQFTGEPIDEVKLDRIPAKNRQSRYQSQGDLILTDDLKYIIKEAANYSLEHPWDSIVK